MLNIGLSELVTETARGLCSVCSTSIVPRTVCIAAVVVWLLQLPRYMPSWVAFPAAQPAPRGPPCVRRTERRTGGVTALVLDLVWFLAGLLLHVACSRGVRTSQAFRAGTVSAAPPSASGVSSRTPPTSEGLRAPPQMHDPSVASFVHFYL